MGFLVWIHKKCLLVTKVYLTNKRPLEFLSPKCPLKTPTTRCIMYFTGHIAWIPKKGVLWLTNWGNHSRQSWSFIVHSVLGCYHKSCASRPPAVFNTVKHCKLLQWISYTYHSTMFSWGRTLIFLRKLLLAREYWTWSYYTKKVFLLMWFVHWWKCNKVLHRKRTLEVYKLQWMSN